MNFKTSDTIPFSIKAAVFMNITGSVCLAFSILAREPSSIALSFAFSTLLLLGGFATWVALVIREAKVKGLFN